MAQSIGKVRRESNAFAFPGPSPIASIAHPDELPGIKFQPKIFRRPQFEARRTVLLIVPSQLDLSLQSASLNGNVVIPGRFPRL
jgi:hypothetical protein